MLRDARNEKRQLARESGAKGELKTLARSGKLKNGERMSARNKIKNGKNNKKKINRAGRE